MRVPLAECNKDSAEQGPAGTIPREHDATSVSRDHPGRRPRPDTSRQQGTGKQTREGASRRAPPRVQSGELRADQKAVVVLVGMIF